MLPTDYKRLKPETLADIKPVTANDEPNDTDETAAWLYLSEMGISRNTAAEARVGCLTQRCVIPDSKKENGETTRCRSIAYVNYVNGQPVNVKYRS